MPELPEVETVKNTLKQQILHKQIKQVNIYHNNTIEYPDPETFQHQIANETIHDLQRRGKWILFELDHYYLLSHLRMEGKYFIRQASDEKLKYELVSFNFTDQTTLRYCDMRKFGKMHLLPKENVNKVPPLNELGLEPWDNHLTHAYLKEKWKSKSLPIKTALLDQTVIVGIGNIYADEILFLCKINPLKKVNELTTKDQENIIYNTREVLEKAIKNGGTTIRSYTSSEGVHGRFQQELLVHNQDNKECSICHTKIIKTKVGGRGTYYCPTCQK